MGDTNSGSVEGSAMAVIKKAAAVGVWDRRSDERVPTLFVTQARLLSALDCTQFDIECLNISRGGLAFRCRIAFHVGERVAVRMQFCNRDGEILLCEVRHCDESPRGNHVGVQILERITAAQQDQFDIPEKWLPKE
jgi:hypothetical protein